MKNASGSGFAAPISSEIAIASSSGSIPVTASLWRWSSDGPFVSRPTRSPRLAHLANGRDGIVEETEPLDAEALLGPVGLEQPLVELGPGRDRLAEPIPAVLPEVDSSLEIVRPVRLEDRVVPAMQLLPVELRHVLLDDGGQCVPALALRAGGVGERSVEVEEDACQSHGLPMIVDCCGRPSEE